MRTFLASVLLAVFFSVVSHIAKAADRMSFAQFQDSNKEFGVTLTKTKQGDTTTVTSTIDEAQSHELIGWLKSVGGMNPDLTDTAENLMPIRLNFVAAITIAESALMVVYSDDATTNKVKYVAQLDAVDEFGHSQVHELFSFDFTRALYDKINWDRMMPKNLPKAAHNFHISTWANKAMSEEPAL
jgi:hypothetical protein